MSANRIAIEEGTVPPSLKIRLPFSHRVNCFLSLWAMKALATLLFTIDRAVRPLPPALQPTVVKRYPCRPSLQTRLFYPDRHKAGELLPVFFCIHGGGFALLEPASDDEWCSMWAKRTGMLVVSLDHSKSPLSPFPTPVFDVAALANAVLDDSSLPIDRSRISIGGFSSGGNLALTASQLPGLRGVVKAALVFYPIVDFGHDPHDKLARRPYKGGPTDSLTSSSWWFDWGYVCAGQNRHDPLLSPYWAKKEDLVPRICIIGAEWDMLRLESQKMMCELAELDQVQEADFEKGPYKWILARGCTHGFTHHWGQKPGKTKKREAKAEPVYVQAVEWLEKALQE